MSQPEFERLVAVMTTLRRECPWDSQQTHRSLVQHLIEEAAETVEAIESGSPDHLREELGDLLLQVVFHAEIAAGFGIGDVARGIADKLIARHPYVFAGEDRPADLHGTWERHKAVEKGRRSALEGIPDQLSAVARAGKILSRARNRGVPVVLPRTEGVGAALLALIVQADAQGIDPDQALRDAVRDLEGAVLAAESAGAQGEP